jgi:GrpB-like predicted nucleotidyltransferase (UPF0157 family)
MIGQYKRDLSVVPYRSEWKDLYDREADLLRSVLGDKALQIEHIGSTSIPGMMAKPIIDMMVAVVSLAQAIELVPEIEALEYIYKPHDTIPERMFFAKESAPEHRTHHLNLAEMESGFWKYQLAFRDHLRAHDKIAGEYVDLKKRIAEEYAQTHQLDLEAKSEFVTSVLELAEEDGKKVGRK